MKKCLCVIFAIISIFNLSFSTFAIDEISTTNNMIETTVADVYAAGLITKASISVFKDGRNMVINGQTNCVLSVVKCGFSKLVIQRRSTNSDSWTTFATYEDFYADDYVYYLDKSLYCPTGFQYRVVATHYAKKNILSTQKMENISGALSM